MIKKAGSLPAFFHHRYSNNNGNPIKGMGKEVSFQFLIGTLKSINKLLLYRVYDIFMFFRKNQF